MEFIGANSRCAYYRKCDPPCPAPCRPRRRTSCTTRRRRKSCRPKYMLFKPAKDGRYKLCKPDRCEVKRILKCAVPCKPRRKCIKYVYQCPSPCSRSRTRRRSSSPRRSRSVTKSRRCYDPCEARRAAERAAECAARRAAERAAEVAARRITSERGSRDGRNSGNMDDREAELSRKEQELQKSEEEIKFREQQCQDFQTEREKLMDELEAEQEEVALERERVTKMSMDVVAARAQMMEHLYAEKDRLRDEKGGGKGLDSGPGTRLDGIDEDTRSPINEVESQERELNNGNFSQEDPLPNDPEPRSRDDVFAREQAAADDQRRREEEEARAAQDGRYDDDGRPPFDPPAAEPRSERDQDIKSGQARNSWYRKECSASRSDHRAVSSLDASRPVVADLERERNEPERRDYQALSAELEAEQESMKRQGCPDDREREDFGALHERIARIEEDVLGVKRTIESDKDRISNLERYLRGNASNIDKYLGPARDYSGSFAGPAGVRSVV